MEQQRRRDSRGEEEEEEEGEDVRRRAGSGTSTDSWIDGSSGKQTTASTTTTATASIRAPTPPKGNKVPEGRNGTSKQAQSKFMDVTNRGLFLFLSMFLRCPLSETLFQSLYHHQTRTGRLVCPLTSVSSAKTSLLK